MVRLWERVEELESEEKETQKKWNRLYNYA